MRTLGREEFTRRRFVRTSLAALLAPGLPGCLGGPTDPGGPVNQGNPRLTVHPHAPTLTPEFGATPLSLSATLRDGLLYVPDSYDPAVPMPLIVTLHGATGNAWDWTGFFPACDGRGMILLAIDSRGRTWDRVGGVFGADVPFIDAALERTFDLCAIDPEHVALAGFSDGASYSLSLGPCNGDIFTHLIAFSPGHTAPTEDLVGSPRVWISHGEQDGVLSVATTRTQIVPTLQSAGYDVTFIEFKGGHELPSAIGSEALDWFLG